MMFKLRKDSGNSNTDTGDYLIVAQTRKNRERVLDNAHGVCTYRAERWNNQEGTGKHFGINDTESLNNIFRAVKFISRSWRLH